MKVHTVVFVLKKYKLKFSVYIPRLVKIYELNNMGKLFR
jgi:hypothetical protein